MIPLDSATAHDVSLDTRDVGGLRCGAFCVTTNAAVGGHVQMKVITTAAVSEKLKINGSLARRALKELMAKGLIKQVSYHKDLAIYTRATHTAA